MSREVWVEAELWNLRDDVEVESGAKPPLRLRCKVDNGSSHTVLPQSVADQLGLPRRLRPMEVTYADLRKATLQVGKGLCLRIQGRDITTYGVIEPNRTSVLVGSLNLEDLGFNIDLEHGTLVPYPGTEAGQCAVLE